MCETSTIAGLAPKYARSDPPGVEQFEPTLADLATHPHIARVWDDNPNRTSGAVTVRAVLAAGVREEDLATFKRAVTPKGSDELAAAIALDCLGTLIAEFPTMTVRDAIAWAMVAEQVWATTLGSVREADQAGLGFGAWRFLAATLSASETIALITEHGSDVAADMAAVMTGLRGTVIPS